MADVRRVVVGSDHTGVALKTFLVVRLRARGLAVASIGPAGAAPTPVDYPDIAEQVGLPVARREADAGIVIDGAGLGLDHGRQQGGRRARGACVSATTLARYAREHNGANVLALGATLLSTGDALAIVETFLKTPMTEPRYIRRLAKIAAARRRPRRTFVTAMSYTALDVSRLVQIITEEVLRATAAGALAGRCACHGVHARVLPGPRCAACSTPARAASGLQASGGARGTVAGLIDHTLLKPDATQAEIETLCREAREYSFATVCVNPTWVPLAARLLRGSAVGVCTVVGFPLGATTADVKQYETRRVDLRRRHAKSTW